MELTLSTGAHLRVRPMPIHVFQQYNGIEEAKLERAPDPPMVEMKSPLTGGSEQVPAGEGDPEYAEWVKEMDAWTLQSQEARAKMNLGWQALMFDYGIIEWCVDYDEDEPENAIWYSEAPDGWEFSPALLRGGLVPSDNPRLDYILLEIIPRPTDYLAALAAIREDAALITEEEVEAQRAGFRTSRGISEATKGQRDPAIKLSRGDGRAKSPWAYARSVVEGIKSRSRRDARA